MLYTPGSTVVDPRTVLEHGGAFAYQLVDTVVTNPPIYLKHMLSVRRATVFIPASVCLLVQDDSVAACLHLMKLIPVASDRHWAVTLPHYRIRLHPLV